MMASKKRTKVDLLTRDFILENDKLRKVCDLLLRDFNRGLSGDIQGTLKMLITYVRDVPNGSEQGKFLALDLGGTNFRVLLIELEKGSFSMDNDIYEIPQEIMLGTGTQLFDRIADCLEHFVLTRNLPNDLPLGFTFSFPCKQEGLTKARLINWTKGFKCSGVENEDVVQLLREAMQRKKVNIDVVGVVNDTTGTLMSCAHKNQKCRAGIIIGTGTNACYMERLENVKLWDGDNKEPCQVIINTEWGAFGDNGCLDFIRTKYDYQIDENSLNPGVQLFEKMISGMYMGEIARRVFVELIQQKLLFNGTSSVKMNTPYAFKSKYISLVESDQKNSYTQTKSVLQKMNIVEADEEDYEIMKLICTRISTRAAFLVSAGIATILNRMQRQHTTVGVDGSVYRYHPHFGKRMEEKVAELTNPDYKFDLMLSEDGSGRGAALVAAVAVRAAKEAQK